MITSTAFANGLVILRVPVSPRVVIISNGSTCLVAYITTTTTTITAKLDSHNDDHLMNFVAPKTSTPIIITIWNAAINIWMKTSTAASAVAHTAHFSSGNMKNVGAGQVKSQI